jgi:hypothetical protein
MRKKEVIQLINKWRETANADCGGLSVQYEKSTLRCCADDLEKLLLSKELKK